METGETRREIVDWIHLTQNRDHWRVLVNTIVNFRVSHKARNLTSWVTISFSRRTPLHGVSWLVT